MALVKCPECGKEISDKAVSCPNCGCPILKNNDSDCNVNEEKIPIIARKINTDKPLTKKFFSNPRNKKFFILGIIIVVVVIIVVAVININNQNKQNKQNEIYKADFASIENVMELSQMDIEDVYSQISTSWYEAIDKGWDFNNHIKETYNTSDVQMKISRIKKSQDAIQKIIQDLKNAPDEYSKAYNALLTLNESFAKYSDFAVSPTGSYQTYTQGFNSAKSDFNSKLSAYEAVAPDLPKSLLSSSINSTETNSSSTTYDSTSRDYNYADSSSSKYDSSDNSNSSDDGGIVTGGGYLPQL